MRISKEDSGRLFDLQDSSDIFEKFIEACYRAELKRGDYAIDGGAHGGMHSRPMAQCVGPNGRVIAFEPIPAICAWLSDVVKDLPNVDVRQKALSDKKGIATFQYLPDEPWLSSLNVRGTAQGKAVEEITVELTLIDDLQDFPVRFIKLDLEGAEFHAIRGARQLLRKQRPIVALECGRIDAAQSAGYGSDDFFALFTSLDYELRDLFGESFGPEQFALPWDDRTVPHYIVAAPRDRQDVFEKLKVETRSALG